MENNKKVLILGGGTAQLELIKTAREMGIQTVVVGSAGAYQGYDIADKVYNVDILDKEKILTIAREENVAGVCMVCSDFGLQTLGYLCDKLKLKGITETSAIISSNKLSMKEVLVNNNIPTARHIKVSNETDIEKALDRLTFPLMIKAVDLQGSKGIFKCTTPEEVFSNYKYILELTKTPYCILEEFIEGEEFGVQAFVWNNDILFILPHGDILWQSGDTTVPIGHFVPYRVNSELLESIHSIVSRSIKAMGYDNCAVNVDLILRNGKVYVIELTGRAGANGLSDITSHYLGIDYLKFILLAATDNDPLTYWATHHFTKQTILSRQLFTQQEGKVSMIQINPNSRIEKTTLFIKPGDTVHKFKNSADCVGRILCRADNLNECETVIKDFISNDLTISIL